MQRLWHIVKHTLLVLFIILLAMACNDDTPDPQSKRDPSLPLQLDAFMPDSGGIRTKFVVKGSNFGSDISKIKVLFSDDEKEATVLGADNETVYCLVPKQSGGDNTIQVVVDDDTTAFDQTFRYHVEQNVSTITGVSGVAGSEDGILSDGRIQRTFGIAAVDGGDLLTFEALSGNVRFISIKDNVISTLQTGFYGAQPAISQDGTKLYCINKDANDHKVVLYDKDALWEPQTIVSGISESSAVIYSCALDDSEKWLYFRDKAGLFGRLELANPSNVNVLNENVGTVGATDYSYLVYSPVDDCFYLSVQYVNGIYKISKDGQNVEEFIGFNGQGYTDAPRLDCKLRYPGGITVDSEGNLYWCDTNSPTIRKYNRKSEYVSTIAGTAGSFGGENGDPETEATFNYPYCINADQEDNLFIGESWGCTIRKLAIE